jgi:hypothetical protein
MVGLEEGAATVRLCTLDDITHSNNWFMGGGCIFIVRKIIHKLPTEFPLKPGFSPMVCPQKSPAYLHFSLIFPGFSTDFNQLSTSGRKPDHNGGNWRIIDSGRGEIFISAFLLQILASR